MLSDAELEIIAEKYSKDRDNSFGADTIRDLLADRAELLAKLAEARKAALEECRDLTLRYRDKRKDSPYYSAADDIADLIDRRLIATAKEV